MVKRYLICIFLLSFVFAEEIELGEKLMLDSTTAVSAILENPEDFLGKHVQINGVVVDVCSNRGCWIDVSSDKPNETIQLKVEDDVIVFPLTAKGREVIAEGILEKLTFSEDEALIFKKHEAEEKDEEFDEVNYKITDADKTIYRLRGLGAIIK